MRGGITTLTLLAAMAAAIFHAGPRQALACSCAMLDGDETRVRRTLDYADAVVIGTVERYEELRAAAPTPYSPDGTPIVVTPVEYRYGSAAEVRVERRFKGPDERTIRVESTGNSASCGYEGLAVRGRHLFVLTGSDGTYRTNLCSAFLMDRVDRPDRYGESLRAFMATLERLAPPVDVPTAAPEPIGYGDDVAERGGGGVPGWVWVAAAIGVVGLAAGAVLAARARR